MIGVVGKLTRCLPPSAGSGAPSSVLEIAENPSGMIRSTWNVALMAGSSQHGKHRRASDASNCVAAIRRSTPSLSRNVLR